MNRYTCANSTKKKGQMIYNKRRMGHITHLMKIFLHVFNIILQISYYLPLWKGMTLYLKKIWIPSTQEIFLNILHIYFYYFVIISPWGRVWAFICKNLNSIYPRILCAKVCWNWPSSFKERIFKYFQYNFTILLLSPLGEWCGPSFEQTWIPSTQGWSEKAIRKAHLSLWLWWANKTS